MFLVTNFKSVVIRVCVCFLLLLYQVHGVAQLVEALRYKPKDRGFDSLWAIEIFYLRIPSGRTMVLGSTQALTKMSTRNVYWRFICYIIQVRGRKYFYRIMQRLTVSITRQAIHV